MCFAEIYKAQYENAMLVHILGAKNVTDVAAGNNIWNLLWLSRWLIISAKQTKIHITTFPEVVTSKKAQIK